MGLREGRLIRRSPSSIMAGVAAWLDARGGLDTIPTRPHLFATPFSIIQADLNKMG
jgi:hypothetical protein